MKVEKLIIGGLTLDPAIMPASTRGTAVVVTCWTAGHRAGHFECALEEWHAIVRMSRAEDELAAARAEIEALTKKGKRK